MKIKRDFETGPILRLFHGFRGSRRAESIGRRGLIAPPAESWRKAWWSSEIGLPPSVFLATSLQSSRGTNPLEYAVAEDQRVNGYIAVVEIPWHELGPRLRGIWLTADVVRYSDSVERVERFCREEFGISSRFFEPETLVSRIRGVNPRITECLNPKGPLLRNPAWLLNRRQSAVQGDEQVVSDSIPAKFIVEIRKVFSGESGRIEIQGVDHLHKTYGESRACEQR